MDVLYIVTPKRQITITVHMYNRSNNFLVVFGLLLTLLPVGAWAQPGPNGDLPENIVVSIDRSIDLPITERSIVRSDLNGEHVDTLAMQFGQSWEGCNWWFAQVLVCLTAKGHKTV
jgi:hypothetical protein